MCRGHDVLLQDFQVDFSVLQPGAHHIAGLHIVDLAHHLAILPLHDRIATRHRGQRAHRFERACDAGQLQGIALQLAGEGGVQARLEVGQPFAQGNQTPPRRVRAKAPLGMAPPAGAPAGS